MLLIAKKHIIQIIFLILSLSELVKNVRACLASFKQLNRNMACRNLWQMQARANEHSIILP